jgi:hypothetical protein
MYLAEPLEYLISFPYGCSEQVSSRLSAIARVVRALSVENIDGDDVLNKIVTDADGRNYSIDELMAEGLAKIYTNQNLDGGFSYYARLDSNFWLTMHLVNTLVDIRDAGYPVDETRLTQAVRFIASRAATGRIYSYTHRPATLSTTQLIAANYAISRSGVVTSDKKVLLSRMEKALSKRYLEDEASSMTVAYAALVALREDMSTSLIDRLFDTMENRIDIDARGAYMRTNRDDIAWEYYESSVKNTALLVKALVAADRVHPLQDRLIRWLLASRDKQGVWNTTHNTLVVIDALTDFLKWSRETESEFSLEVQLGTELLAAWDIDETSILETFAHEVPMSQIPKGEVVALSFEKSAQNDLPNRFYYDVDLRYFLPVENLPPRDEGILVDRQYYRLTDSDMTTPVHDAKVGEVLLGEVSITSGVPIRTFSLENYIPAGVELVNFDFETEAPRNSLPKGDASEDVFSIGEGALQTSDELRKAKGSLAQRIIGSLGAALGRAVKPSSDNTVFLDEERRKPYMRTLRPDFKELRDDRLFLFDEYLGAGTYTYQYYVRAITPGTYRHLPAVASEMYFPENFGRTEGSLFRVTQ